MHSSDCVKLYLQHDRPAMLEQLRARDE